MNASPTTRDNADASKSPSRWPRTHRRRLHNVLLAVGGLLAAGVVVVLGSEAAGWRYLRQPLQWVASSATGRAVQIDPPLRIHVLRREPIASAGGLRIAAPDWSQAAHFVATGPIAAAAGWSGLLMRPDGVLRLQSLSVAALDVVAERRADGSSSWQFGEPKAESTAGGGVPSIVRLEIDGGHVVVRDEPQALALDLAVTLREGTGVDRSGVRIQGNGNWQKQPIEIDVSAPGVLPVASGGGLEGLVAKLRLGETRLSYDGRIGDPLRGLDVVGDIELSGKSLGDLGILPGVTLPSTKPYAVAGRVARAADRIDVRVDRASIGDSRLAGEFRFDPNTQPPKLSGRLTGPRLQLQDLGPAVGAKPDPKAAAESAKAEQVEKAKASAAAKDGSDTRPRILNQAMADKVPARPSPQQQRKAEAQARIKTAEKADLAENRGRVLPQRPLDLPSMKQMDADVLIDLARFDAGTDAIAQMTNLRGRILLQGGVLEIKDLQTQLAGGRIAGGIGITPLADGKAADWRVKLDWGGIDLARFLKQTPDSKFVAGRFSGATSLTGRGASSGDVLASLNGDLRALVHGGKVSHQIVELVGLDVAQALGLLIKGDALLPVDCAMFDFAAKDGRLSSRAGVIDTPNDTIVAGGTIGLKDESLALRLVATPRDWSPLSLRSPVTVGGTFAAPSIGIDPRPLAIKAVAGLALAAITPIAGLLPLMDWGEADDKTNSCAQVSKRLGKAPGSRDSAPGAAGTIDKEGTAPFSKLEQAVKAAVGTGEAPKVTTPDTPRGE